MKSIILVLMMVFSLSGFAQTKSNDAPAKTEVVQTKVAEAPVKKSKTGICHAPGSTYYARTTHFTPFKTLDDCLKSGGRLPKR